MLFRQLFDQESSTYTYLLAADYGRDAIIIDPVKTNVKQYIVLMEQLELTLVAAIDTHLHADHITAIGELSRQLQCQSMMGKESPARNISAKFEDNDTLEFDGLQLIAMHTPGHTHDSYCLLMRDRVFTGDTLFIRSTGRTDFQNGSPTQQYDSLFNRLLCLPERTLVYPGHDYNGMTVSTIGEEIRWNPRLQVASREAYVQLMNQLNLPLPKKMRIAVPANQNAGMMEDSPITS